MLHNKRPLRHQPHPSQVTASHFYPAEHRNNETILSSFPDEDGVTEAQREGRLGTPAGYLLDESIGQVSNQRFFQSIGGANRTFHGKPQHKRDHSFQSIGQ